MTTSRTHSAVLAFISIAIISVLLLSAYRINEEAVSIEDAQKFAKECRARGGVPVPTKITGSRAIVAFECAAKLSIP